MYSALPFGNHDYAAMMANIADCLDILARPERVNAIIGEELENIREEYGDERRSTIDLMGDPNFNKRDLIPRRDMVVTLSRGGYIKSQDLADYDAQTRGGKGLRNYRLTEKTGLVAGAAIVDDTNDVMLIESGGVVLRTPAASINLYGRDTQGVILMRIEEGNRVIGVEAISNTEETEESGEE